MKYSHKERTLEAGGLRAKLNNLDGTSEKSAIKRALKGVFALGATVALGMGVATALPQAALAANGEVASSDGKIDVSKTIKHNEGDNYTLALDLVGKNTKESQEITTPLDIVLVLDVSGSMDNPIGEIETTTYQEVYDGRYSKLDTWRTYYVRSGNDYIAVTWEGNYYNGSWQDRSGNEYEPRTSRDDNNQSHVQFYQQITASESAGSKIDALKEAANGFAETFATMNDGITDTSKQHRISVVKFSGNESNQVGNNTYREDRNTYNYSQVVSDLRSYTTQTVSNLERTINSLDPAGSTRADYGLSQAERVLNGEGNLTGARTGSQKVVIFFTDGQPSTFSDWSGTVAADAINTAHGLKQNGTLVYTIGVFEDANPSDTYNNFNRYMNAVSSNYLEAQCVNSWGGQSSSFGDLNLGDKAKDNYYFTADNASALGQVFQGITSSLASGANYRNTVIYDKMSEYDDASISVEGAEKDADGFYNITDGNHGVSFAVSDAEGNPVNAGAEGYPENYQIFYNPETKELRVELGESYDQQNGWHYTVTFDVKPSDKAYEYFAEHDGEYPHKGDENTDANGNSTSSRQPGFYSNSFDTANGETAKVTYDEIQINEDGSDGAKTEGTEYFPRPVLQVTGVKVHGALEVEKIFQGERLEAGEFKFKVTAENQDGANRAWGSESDGGKAPLSKEFTNDAGTQGQGGFIAHAWDGSPIAFTEKDVEDSVSYTFFYTEIFDKGLEDKGVIFDDTAWKVVLTPEKEGNELVVKMLVYRTELEDGADVTKVEADDWKPCGANLEEADEAHEFTIGSSDDAAELDSVTLAFRNWEIGGFECTYPIGVDKTLEGDALQEGMFRFTIEAVNSDTVEADDAARKAGFVNQDGELDNPKTVYNGVAPVALINGMKFEFGDKDKAYRYLIKEDLDYIAEGFDKNDYLYDETEYYIEFRPTVDTVDGNKEVVVDLYVAVKNPGETNFSNYELVGRFTRLGFSSKADGAQTLALTGEPEYALEFNNKVSKADLSITKQVESSGPLTAPAGAQFMIQIDLKDENGKAITGEFGAMIGDQSTTVSFNNVGIGTVTLEAGQTIVINDLPVGATYKVTEPESTMPGGFQLLWIDRTPDLSNQAEGRAANKKEHEGEIGVEDNDVTVSNSFIGYGLEIYKGVAKDEDGTIVADPGSPLPAAQFTVYQVSNDTEMNVNNICVDDNIYAQMKAETEADGYVTFEPFTTGTYYFKETRVPSGYQMMKKVVQMVVSIKDGQPVATFTRYSIDEETGDLTADEQGVEKSLEASRDESFGKVFKFDVANKPNPDLPQSGSSGTLIMSSVGVATIILAGVYLLNRRFPLNK